MECFKSLGDMIWYTQAELISKGQPGSGPHWYDNTNSPIYSATSARKAAEAVESQVFKLPLLSQ